MEYVHSKVSSHATASTQLSGSIRVELKDYQKELVDTNATLGILKSNLETLEHVVSALKVNLKGVTDVLAGIQNRFESTLKKVRARDGHTEFAVRLVEVASKELEGSFATLNQRNSYLETENHRLATELENLVSIVFLFSINFPIRIFTFNLSYKIFIFLFRRLFQF